MRPADILLIQIRQSQIVADEEANCFAQTGNFAPESFHRVNLFDNPNLQGVEPQAYRAIIVGGASDATVLQPDKYPFVLPAQEFMRRCVGQQIPTFASCFGFQLAVKALGGDIFHQDDDFELGTIPITLTPAAARDVLASGGRA